MANMGSVASSSEADADVIDHPVWRSIRWTETASVLEMKRVRN
jgi:hypothetical protein